jgi:hypothetical protein
MKCENCKKKCANRFCNLGCFNRWVRRGNRKLVEDAHKSGTEDYRVVVRKMMGGTA